MAVLDCIGLHRCLFFGFIPSIFFKQINEKILPFYSYFLVHSSGHDSDSVSSTADFAQERAAPSRQKDQNQSLLDKLTQEKLDSKTKLGNKRNDLSSGTAKTTCCECFCTLLHPSCVLFFG